jgi:hypothetical protein
VGVPTTLFVAELCPRAERREAPVNRENFISKLVGLRKVSKNLKNEEVKQSE